MSYDLVLRGGRVIDPAQGLDKVMSVGFSSGKVAGVADTLAAGPGTVVLDMSGLCVSPGFIDLHTHVYWRGSALGVDPAETAHAGGVTTLVDAGSAGPGNFAGFRKHVIEPSSHRILAYLNVSFAGIFAFSKNIMVGESGDMRLITPIDTLAVAAQNRDVIVGIKVRVGRHASGNSGIAPLDIALQVGEELGLPIMAHIDEPPPDYESVVDRLRAGDVLTHCFRPFPNTPVRPNGSIKRAVSEGRQRGVLFDVGHGMGSFSFRVARAMLDAGFPPDTISSDIHLLNLDGPVFDQATTLSKFLALGVPLADVIRMTTVNAAAAIRRPELGGLAPGAAGDATVFALSDAPLVLTNSVGETLSASRHLEVVGTVIGGRYVKRVDAADASERMRSFLAR